MKHWILGVAFVVGGTVSAMADPAIGVWQTEASDTGSYLHVSIAKCGAELCGTIQTAFDESGTAAPDYEHLGRRMIWDMEIDGGAYYSGGQIWAPDADKTYSSKMTLDGNVLTVKGCTAGGLVCRGQDWKRVK